MAESGGSNLATELNERDLADLAGASVLLVDDNLQNLELMQAYLEGLHCTLRTARDGIEAVRMIDENPPDLVLLDVMMPRMSGFEVCQRIKGSPATSNIMVIMVTALHEVGDFERAKEAGTDDFITKPVNKLELLTRVESLLRFALLKREYDRLLQLTRRSELDDTGDMPAAGER